MADDNNKKKKNSIMKALIIYFAGSFIFKILTLFLLFIVIVAGCASVIGLFSGTGGTGGVGTGTGGYINPDPEYQDLRHYITPTEQELNDFIKSLQPDSPYVGHADWFIKGAEKYKVDPAFAIGVAVAETSLGTTGNAKTEKHNVFNVGAVNDSPYGSAMSYSSYEDAVYGFYEAIADWYAHEQCTIHDIEYCFVEDKVKNPKGMYSVVTEADNYPESDRDMAHPINDRGKTAWVNLRWIRDITNVMKKAPWRTAEKIAQYNAQKGGSSSGASSSGNQVIEDAISWALDKCGKWGYSMDTTLRMSEGYADCSSFVYRAYLSAGLDLMSIGATGNNTTGEVTAGTEVPYDSSKPIGAQVKRGDLLFTGSNDHVVLCLGNNEYVAASTDENPFPEQIKTGKLDYYNDKVYAIRRVVN